MYIEIHGLNAVIHDMGESDVIEMLNILHIDYDLLKVSSFSNIQILEYSFGDNKQSVYIRVNSGYVMLNLKGSFFDNSPEFRLKKLLRFLSRFKHTFKQLDVAFTDDMKCLTKKEIQFWCRRSSDYCTGSLVARRPPEIVKCAGRLSRIHLGEAKSKTNFGTIYQRPDTRYIRIEIKFKRKDKIEYLLEDYSTKNIEKFNSRCLESLVSCINFITAQSKKNRVASRYKKQRAWESFLGSDIVKIKWSTIYNERHNNRSDSDDATISKGIRRQATMINNMIGRLKPILSEEDVVMQFERYSGYKLVKNDDM
jgi:hypothetical protein